MEIETIKTYKAVINLYSEKSGLFINEIILSNTSNLIDCLYHVKNKYNYIESLIIENMKLYINDSKYKRLKNELEKSGLKAFIYNRINIIEEIKTINKIAVVYDFMEE